MVADELAVRWVDADVVMSAAASYDEGDSLPSDAASVSLMVVACPEMTASGCRPRDQTSICWLHEWSPLL